METVLPVFLLIVCVAGLAVFLVLLGNVFNPKGGTEVKRMPYESGMDPIHDTRRRFDVRFHLLAIAFLVFDVELLFLYPWAVTARPAQIAASQAMAAQASGPIHSRAPEMRETVDAVQQSSAGRQLVQNHRLVFAGVMLFVALLALGFVYDWRKGIFEWR